MILIINVCKEKLHYYEFVKPIESILERSGIKYLTKPYQEISNVDEYDKVIICGTSLKDNEFIKEKFNWLKETNKKVLGICAGFQIIGLMFNSKLKKKTEIGFFNEEINILNVKGNLQVYHLHNNYIEFTKDFEILSKGKIVQAFRKNNLYGVLFHPEVRNKEIIENFCSL